MENCGNFFFISSDNNNHHHHNNIWSLNCMTSTSTTTNISSSTVYGGDGSHVHPDPHLMCLKLGKRHYFENPTSGNTLHVTTSSSPRLSPKRGKPYYAFTSSVDGSSNSAGSTAVPRCQVEGCHVALLNAKDYHKRHKVCEMHSKAPKVIVLGLEQRFCQQCSRFHVVSEFDETKRSCRRRLAGHNERRRKSSHESASKNTASQDRLIMGRFQYLTPPTGCALSLLSSKSDSWVSSSSHHDISSRSSAALRELIAEHRATILARQLILGRNLHHDITIDDLANDHQSHTSVSTSNS